MKWIIPLLLLMALPVLAQVPPMPPPPSPPKLVSPKHAEHISSLGQPMVRTTYRLSQGFAQAPAAQVAPTFLMLTWNYPPDLVPLVVFEVYHATYLNSFPVLTNAFQIPSGFTLLLEVTGGTNCLVQPYQAAEFFIVRARDISTGAYSAWNVASATTGPLERVVMVTPTNGQEVSGTITLKAQVITLDPPFTLTMR